MALPESDVAFLADRDIDHEVVEDGGMTCVLFRNYPLPKGYDSDKMDLLVRLQPGYPDVAPDMWWCDPPARRTDGTQIPATEVVEHLLGRNWQRWSRHFTDGQWKSGIDGLESFLALVRRELSKWGLETAA
jgi:hypothetical protein